MNNPHIHNSFSSLNNYNLNLEPVNFKTTHSFHHDQLFNKYQNKIKKNIEKKDIEKKNNDYKKSKKGGFIEGFNLLETNVTQQAKNVYSSTGVSTEQSTANQQLLTSYEDALALYQSDTNKITKLIENYFAQIGPSNPYLGKNIRFTDSGATYYVTQQGVAKFYSEEIWNSLIGNPNSFPNCPSGASNNWINIDIPWSQAYLTHGNTIPTTPQLTVGTPMITGQSCGNEGKNVIVNSLIENNDITFIGNYTDNPKNPLMTPIGSQGTNFLECEQKAAMDGYTYFGLQDVNSSNTGQCMGTNNLSQATSLGKALKATPNIIWSSNTSALGGTSASLTTSGTLVVYDGNSNIVFQSPSPTITAPPANSQAAIAAQSSNNSGIFGGYVPSVSTSNSNSNSNSETFLQYINGLGSSIIGGGGF